tara:strand:+ start:38807 stop:38926 length:120 start_codon:yes stop_codon:yes gene_type:complete
MHNIVLGGVILDYDSLFNTVKHHAKKGGLSTILLFEIAV